MDRLTEIYFDEFGIKHTRLKDNIAKKTYRSYTFTPQEIANEKLAELEDFMEEHKCHSVGDLMLEFTISAVDKLNLKLTEEKLAEMKAKLTDLNSKIVEEMELSAERRQIIEDLTIENKQLEQQLAETDKLMQEYLSKCLSLEQQLAEKDAEVQSWKDGTMVVKLGKLEEQLAEKEKFLEKIMSGEYIPAKIAEKSLKLSNQTAIAELEKVKAKVRDVSGALALCEVEVQIDQQIKSLKGEK